MDRRIDQLYLPSGDEQTPTTNALDLSLMSFQSQLAIAIMESQHQMMENGGYGRPDDSQDATQGVSDQVKARWQHYQYQHSADQGGKSPIRNKQINSHTSSITKKNQILDLKSNDTKHDDEQPSCSICLCEYETGEQLLKLPCKHIYHEQCITAWCNNHIRCPLCNCNLLETNGDDQA